MNVKGIIGKMAVAALFFFLSPGGLFAQSYIGVATEAANLRSGPGTDYPVVVVLPEGAELFINNIQGENGFYPVVVIASDTSGWIAKSLVNLVQGVADSDEKIFTPWRQTKNKMVALKIRNDSGLTMTLALNHQNYSFKVGEEKTLELPAGSYQIMASAPGVIPYVGTDTFEGYVEYVMSFYITSVLDF
jgi:SH3-like domain-containing protein